MPSHKNKNSKQISYLTETDVLVIHAKIIDATTGSHGVRDIKLLGSAIERPKMSGFGVEMFPSVFEKSACYLHSIAFNHPFVDGNKRTSFALAVRFLFLNGYVFFATDKEVENHIVTIVVDHHDIKQIALWLKKWSKKKSNSKN